MTILKESHGYALIAYDASRERTGEESTFTVVAIDHDKRQVYAAIPGDKPKGGGTWCAVISDSGVRYVSNGYSRGYANRVYRELVAAAARFDGPAGSEE